MFQVYIGQTSKTLEIRMKQHKANVRSENKNSGIFQQVKNENYTIKWDEDTILFKIKHFYTRNIVESLLIKNTLNNKLNLNTGLFNIKIIIERKIFQHLKIEQ